MGEPTERYYDDKQYEIEMESERKRKICWNKNLKLISWS